MFVQSSRPLLQRQAFEAIAQAWEGTRWSCVPAPLSCYGADADLPGSFFSRQYRLTCPRCVSVILNQLPGSPSPPLLKGSQHRSAGNTGGPTQRARSFAAGLRDAITAAANH
jgi:hypothetical protein